MNQPTTFSREATIVAFALLSAGAVGILASNSGGAALVAPVVLAGGVLLFIRPMIGMCLLAGTLPLEASLMVEGASIPRLVGMAVFGTWAAQKLFHRERLGPLVSPALVQVAFLLFALACLSMLWAQYPQGLERRLFILFQLILLVVLIADLTSSWERIAWIVKFLVLAGVVAALITVQQHYFGGLRRAGEGVVGGINRTAAMLVSLLPFAFYLLRSREHLFWRWLGVAYVGFAAVGVAATLSRMTYLVFPMVVVLHLALMARTRAGRHRVFLLAAATVLGVTLLPMEVVEQRAESIVPYITQSVGPDDPSESQTARGYHFRMGLAIFRDHPILGAGYQNYGRHFLTYQWYVPGAPLHRVRVQNPHNSHFVFLANLGMVGFVLWATLFVVASFYLWRAWRELRDPISPPALLVQAIAIALGVQWIYGFYREIHQDKIFWLVLGLALAVSRLVKAESEAGGAQPPGAEAATTIGLRSEALVRQGGRPKDPEAAGVNGQPDG